MNSVYVPMDGETGGYMGPKGKLQTRRLKALLVKSFPQATVDFHPNHYCCSAFIKFTDDCMIYFSSSDYRFFEHEFYVREVKHMKDYIGGVNHNYKGYDKIVSAIHDLKHEILYKIV
jgi:hypothetical protein